MTTLKQAHSHEACYFGDRPDWLIAYTQHRDSDTLSRSNWTSFVEALGGESDTVAIERSNHWAVGWVEYLVIDPTDAARIAEAERLLARLEDYPVLDEMAWSNLEQDEYHEAWKDYGKSDFVRGLVREFGLSDAAEELLDQDDDLQAFFESLIPSGEYYHAEGSGVSIQTGYAVKACTRETIGQYLRQLIRAGQVVSK